MHRAITRRFVQVVALLLCGCAPIEPQSDVESGGPVLGSLQVYTAGDGVTFVLQILNTTDAPIDVTFPTGQRFDFLVRDGEREVWRWSSDMGFTQALGTERIEGGGALRYEAVWRPEPSLRGDFTVVGLLTSSDHGVQQSTRITLP